jgi:hypothetical protein
MNISMIVLEDISKYSLPLYKVNTEGDVLRRRKETLLVNILKPSLNDK